MGHLWPWPVLPKFVLCPAHGVGGPLHHMWSQLLRRVGARGRKRDRLKHRPSRALAWHRSSRLLLLRMWALVITSFFCLSLDIDCLSYSNRILFNSLCSCLKLLVKLTTSPLLLCLPHQSSGSYIPFPSPDVFWVDPSWSHVFHGYSATFSPSQAPLFALLIWSFTWMILHNILNDIFIAVFARPSIICWGRCFTNNIITLKT